MWGAIIRIGARYAFFRRWKNTFILIGAILLCGITVFLIDAKMYLSAGFAGALAALVVFGVGVHYLQERREIRAREQQKHEQAVKRAAAAAARGEAIDKAKASVAGMAKGVSDGAAGLAGVAKTGFFSARDRLGSLRSKRGEEP